MTGIRMTRAVATLLVSMAATAAAQGVVVHGSTSSRYVELRPLSNDSVHVSQATDLGNGYHRTDGGAIVTCEASGWCRFQRSGDRAALLALVQDVDATAWGLGRGVSANLHLRARSAIGGGRALWPQADRTIDALAAYAELDREAYRVRLGRQWQASAVGVFNFDGAAVRWRPRAAFTLDAWAGGALVEGLMRPVTDGAIAAVEDIPPDDRSWVLGASGRFRSGTRAAARMEYLREIRTDREGLYAERIAMDAELRVARGAVSASAARDLIGGAWNELQLRATHALGGGADATAFVRRYEPFFSSWTIWGVFDPVGFDEVRGEVRWSGVPGLALAAHGGKRWYQPQEAGFSPFPLRTDGWRLGVSGSARAVPRLTIDGAWSIDVGNGASSSDVDAGARWDVREGLTVALRGTGFQTVLEYHLGGSTVYGVGADVAWRVTPGVRLVADVMTYRHADDERTTVADWNQKRAGLRLEWTLGGDPGLAAARRTP